MKHAVLIVTRKSSLDAIFSDATILVDEEVVGVVGNDKSLEIALIPGPRAVRARMNLVKSKPLEFTAIPGGRYSAELSLSSNFRIDFLFLFGLPPSMELSLTR